jgi:hypothetical protein
MIKKSSRARAFGLIAFAFLTGFAGRAQAAEIILKVNVVIANIRTKPDLASPVLKAVNAGTLLIAQAKVGVWYKLDLPADASGQSVLGYIHEQVVLVVETTPSSALPRAPVRAIVQAPPAQPVAPAAPVTPPPGPQGYAPAPSLGGGINIRPYLKLGYLAAGPNAADLGYASVDNTSLDQYLSVSGANFGGGVQVLTPLSGRKNLRIGAELGFQTLFSSHYDAFGSPTKSTTADYHDDSELEFSLLGVVELLPGESPFFLQGGLGGHFVLWKSRYVHEGIAGNTDETETGTSFNFGLMAAAGLSLQAGNRLTIPISVRLDYIIRYRGFIAASAVIGFSFN